MSVENDRNNKVKITSLISDEDRRNRLKEAEASAPKPIQQTRDPKREVIANILRGIEEREKARKMKTG